MSEEIYDVVIVGGGIAGLTAAVYACRARMNVLMVERFFPGGQLMMCELIENFPGQPNGLSGTDLAALMQTQAEKFGLQTRFSEIEDMELDAPIKKLHVSDGEDILCKTVILCVGARPKILGARGEAKFLGKGVSYCAVCDGALFPNKKLAVVGGGDTAVEDAMFLTKFASEVHIIHRRDKLRAQQIIQERAFANDKIIFHWDSVIEEIAGTEMVEKVLLKNVKTNMMSELEVSGVFVLVGTDPNTKFLQGKIALDELGYITTDENMQTSVPGVYAAGDVRQKLLRQLVTAAADGAIAATAAEKYVESN